MKYWLMLFTIFIAQLIHLPAQANLLPPQSTSYTSSSFLTFGIPMKTKMKKNFRVDQTALKIHCRNNCVVEAEYQISSRQSSNNVLSFVLPRRVRVQASVNGVSIPVSMTSAYDLTDLLLKRKDHLLELSQMQILLLERPLQAAPLFIALFSAPFSAGSNTIRIQYEQPFNRNFQNYRPSTIQRLRYELWPLRNWYLSDTFTMNIYAEFTTTLPKEDELLVHYYDDPFAKSSTVERFSSPTATIVFKKQWKHTFPGRIIWFIGNKDLLEVSKGIMQQN